jgi:beta-glucanase (GH16 family)
MRRHTRSSMKALTLVVAALASAGLGIGCGKETTWELVWQDEFIGDAGQAPDPRAWTYDVGGGGWGNNQLEYDTDRVCQGPSDTTCNARLDGQGHLEIVARLDDPPFPLGRYFTSARIVTRGRVEQREGRIEARLKLPTGQGIWPAFWMLGADYPAVGWPQCGEIDIMEARGQEPAVVHGSLHGPGYFGGGAFTQSYRLPGGAGFNDDYHVFAVEWDDAKILFEVDGSVYQRVGKPDVEAKGKWVFDHPFYIILNVAVGGDYVGSPDGTTSFPQSMLVDYVKVFERKH